MRTTCALSVLGVLLGLLVLATPAVAAVRRSIVFQATPATVTVGSVVKLSGRVTESPKGTPVRVERRVGTTWRAVRTVRTTTAAGNFSWSFKSAGYGSTTYRARVAKTRIGKAAVSPVRTVRVDRRTAVTLSASDREPTTQDEVVFSGKASPFVSGTSVTLQRLVGSTWVDDGVRGRISSVGGFSFSRSAASGLWTYRARVSRTTNYMAEGISSGVTLDVRGPATFAVEVINVPAGLVPNVVVQAPGIVESLTASKTYAKAPPGAWHVDAAPLVAEEAAFWPAEPTHDVVLGRAGSVVVLIDYSIEAPLTTKVVTADQQIEASENTPGSGVFLVEVSPPTTPEARYAARALRQQGTASAGTSFGTCPYRTGDNVAFEPSEDFPRGAIGRASDAQCLTSGINSFYLDVKTNVTYADMITDGNSANRAPMTFRMSGQDEVADGDKFERSINGYDLTRRTRESVTKAKRKKTAPIACDGGATLSVTGDLELTPVLTIDPRWGPWNAPGLQSFNAKASIEESSTLTISAGGAITCTAKEVELGKIYFAPMYFTLGIPIVVSPELRIVARANVTAEAAGSYSIHQRATTSGSVAWTPASGLSKSVSPIDSRIDEQATRDSVQLSGTLAATASLRAELTFRFNAVGTATAYAEASLGLRAAASASPTGTSVAWGLGPSASAGGNFGFEIFGWGIQSPDFPFFEWCTVPLASGGWNDPDQPVITTAVLPEAILGQSYSVQLKSTKGSSRGGSWSRVSGTLPTGMALSGSGLLSGTPSGTGGSATLAVAYADACGRRATRTLDLTSVQDSLAPAQIGVMARDAGLPSDVQPTQQSAPLVDIACAAGGSSACVAYGTYPRADGSSRPYLVRSAGGIDEVIQASYRPAPEDDLNWTIADIACPTDDWCLLAGTKAGGMPVLATLSGSALAFVDVPVPAWSGDTGYEPTLSGLYCAGKDDCVLAGYAHHGTQAITTHGFVTEYHDGSVSSSSLPNPSDGGSATSTYLIGVQCWQTGECVTVGMAEGGGAAAKAVLRRRVGETWTTHFLPREPNGPIGVASDRSMSCPTPDRCFVLGRTSESNHQRLVVMAVTDHDAVVETLAPLAADRLNGPFDQEGTQIVCPNVSTCLVATTETGPGSYPSYANIDSVVQRRTASGWIATAVPSIDGADPHEPGGRVASVACPTAANCLVFGTVYLGNYGGGSRLATGWSYPSVAQPFTFAPPLASSSYITGGVACSSANSCTVAGYWDLGFTKSVGMLADISVSP